MWSSWNSACVCLLSCVAQQMPDPSASAGITAASGAGSLTVQVFDPTGRPWPGAPISLVQITGGSSYVPEWTNAQGRARFEGLAPAIYRIYRLEDGAERDEIYAIVRPGAESLASLGGATGTQITVKGGVRSNELGLAGAEVWFERARWPRSRHGAVTTTTSDGRFEVGLPAPDVYELVVRPALAKGSAVSYRIRRRLGAMNDSLGLDLPHARVTGQVVDADGRPMRGLRIAVLTGPVQLDESPWPEIAYATSDADGRFELQFLPRARLVVEARPTWPFASGTGPVDTAWARAEVDTSGDPRSVDDVRIVLPRAGRLRGLARSARGEPLANVWVVARELGEPSWAAHLVGRTDDEGRFLSAGVPEGDTEVWVDDHAGSSARLTVRVPAEGTVDVELVGVPSATLELLALDVDGNPAAFRARLLDAEGRVLLHDGPLDELSFVHVVPNVPLGDFRIVGCDLEGRELRATVRVAEAGRRQLVLTAGR